MVVNWDCKSLSLTHYVYTGQPDNFLFYKYRLAVGVDVISGIANKYRWITMTNNLMSVGGKSDVAQ